MKIDERWLKGLKDRRLAYELAFCVLGPVGMGWGWYEVDVRECSESKYGHQN